MPFAMVLRTGEEVPLDWDDAEVVRQARWRLSETKQGKKYVVATGGKARGHRKVYLHRHLMNAPSGLDVDHINGNGLDNRRCNLRLATRSQNIRNNRPIAGASSAYKGVGYRKSRGSPKKWAATIFVAGKTKLVGYFLHEQDAARAYDAAAREHFGEFAFLNFPTGEQA